MWNGRRIAVVIPAFNEARLLPRTLGRVPTYVDLLVVVDDASSDATAAVAAAQTDRRICLVRHPDNRGVGAAIVSGYRRALQLGADVLVVMAADDQMDPADLPSLLDPIARGSADYAKGNRFLHPSVQHMPRARRLGSRVLSWLTRQTTALAVDDCQCGYTALSAAMAERLELDALWPRYGYPNDLLALLANAQARVVDVPVTAVYADETSGLRLRHALGIALRILRRGLWLARARAKAQGALRSSAL